MILLPDYEISEVIHDGLVSTVYRGIRKKDRLPVVLKVLKREYPSSDELKAFQHQHELLGDIEVKGIIRTFDLVHYRNTLVLIMEDFSGGPLNLSLPWGGLGIRSLLSLFIKLTETLSEIHKKNIIHKDINPQHILLNPVTGDVRLIGFGIATRLSREIQAVVSPASLEGTLQYISPEQTGRMNRSIDYRTDYYSFGISLYEIMTGKLPFDSVDAIEIIHGHMAKIPSAPRQINPDVPLALSKIIVKLISKNAEDRYQSAAGLIHDFERCLAELDKHGTVRDFHVGEHDYSDRLKIPEKLYGRKNEISRLLGVFQKVSEGHTEIVFVSGLPGIGKSALINEIHKPVVEKHGYFISGKFDQLKRGVPYFAIIQALRSFARLIISEKQDSIQAWKEKILTAVGSNGRIITDMVPEFEIILGKQPAVPKLPPMESQNRLNTLFPVFLNTFADVEHPLVLFIDDLQWADGASLRMLDMLHESRDLKYLMIIGSYRNNEVGPTHLLTLLFEKMRKDGHEYVDLAILPLKTRSIQQLVSEALHRSDDEVKELSEMILVKSGGNPFFIQEYVKMLYDENLIEYRNGWIWDIEKIRQSKITENVVDLMATKISRLSPRTFELMKIACCIGVRFNIEAMESLLQKKGSEIMDDLREAVNGGIIIRNGSDARFSHDKVQEACYCLIEQKEREMIHYRIGKSLMYSSSDIDKDEWIFSLATQMNLAKNLLNAEEKKQLVFINIRAGRRAKNSGAFDTAIKFYRVGKEYLPDDAWETEYTKALTLYTEIAETEYLRQNMDEAGNYFRIILENAHTEMDKVDIYLLKIRMLASQFRIQESISYGLEVLRRFHVRIPQKAGMLDIIPELVRLRILTGKRKPDDFIALPDLKDERRAAVRKIMAELLPITFIGNPQVSMLLSIKIVKSSIKSGLDFYSSMGFSAYTLLYLATSRDADTAYQYGLLAEKILERYSNDLYKTQICYMNNGFINHWKKSYRSSIIGLNEGYRTGIEYGNSSWAAYNKCELAPFSLVSGCNLNRLDESLHDGYLVLQKLKEENSLIYLRPYLQLVKSLIGMSPERKKICGEFYDEDRILPLLEKNNNLTGLAAFYHSRMILNYIFEDYGEALVACDRGSAPVKLLMSKIQISELYFYQSLVIARLYKSFSLFKKRKYSGILKKNIARFEKWVSDCPENFRQHLLLMKAESLRISGDRKAMFLYDEAIQSARDNGFLHIEAIACECAAKYYIESGLLKIARMYFLEAEYCYRTWGAEAKASDLAVKYPEIFESLEDSSRIPRQNTVRSLKKNELDLSAILKATQSISGEIEMKSFLQQMTRIIARNAGAQKVVIIMNKMGELTIEAQLNAGTTETELVESVPADSSGDVPSTIINYVAHSKDIVHLDNVSVDGTFINDPYVKRNRPMSILCIPIIRKNELMGILYLENNLSVNAFTLEHLETLRILSIQAAISIQNIYLYENTLQEKERLLVTLRSIGDGVITSDVNGRVLLINRVAEKLTGWLQDEAEGKYVHEVFHIINGETKDICRNPIERVLEQQVVIELEDNTVLIDRFGAERLIKDSGAPIRDSMSRIIGVVLVFRDVTEESRIESELAKIIKLDSLGILAGGIAHDFNNILTALLGNLNLAKRCSPDTELLELLDEAEKAAHSSIFLTNQLLTFAKGGEPVKKSGLINSVLKDSVLFSMRGSNISIDFDLDESIGTVEYDEGQMSQVFHNLAINARQAMPDGGMLKVSSVKFSNRDSDSRGLLFGEYIRITFEDNGTGISREHLQKIFDPFFTTKQQGKGLGLASCYSIIRKHGGIVIAESEFNSGATFVVYLPNYSGSTIDNVESDEGQGIIPGSGRILFMDDEEDIHNFVKKALKLLGYTVDVARNGAEAVEKYRATYGTPLQFTCAILDITIRGGMGGVETIAELKKINPDIVSIVTSGYSKDPIMANHEEYGFNGVLVKPFRFEELGRLLSMLLKKVE